MKGNCSSCIYTCFEERQRLAVLLCTRYPPVERVNGDRVEYDFVQTKSHWRCGEYSPVSPTEE